MKKAYTAPQLTNYGSVQSVTNAFGRAGGTDSFFIGTNPTPIPGSTLGLSGSQNGVLIPR
ncbi:lasso peptide [Nostoc sp. FACHB-280]|uniref:lasso peptide n=1 Tax=Nostoc sp. FACHB-280 TaxID=2692839 RepID=UPI00168B8079|nr:lasso peptide [Nostoc sp. FACHB-280]MBD2494854.1 lasso peptide [Nostoc sp. FACHB-280]